MTDTLKEQVRKMPRYTSSNGLLFSDPKGELVEIGAVLALLSASPSIQLEDKRKEIKRTLQAAHPFGQHVKVAMIKGWVSYSVGNTYIELALPSSSDIYKVFLNSLEWLDYLLTELENKETELKLSQEGWILIVNELRDELDAAKQENERVMYRQKVSFLASETLGRYVREGKEEIDRLKFENEQLRTSEVFKTCMAQEELLNEMRTQLNTAEQEIERLSSPDVESLEYKKGSLDLRLSNVNARNIMGIFIDLFEQNGGKNYLTSTFEAPAKNKRYGITITNLNGELSPAEKINSLEQQLKQAEEALEYVAATTGNDELRLVGLPSMARKTLSLIRGEV